MQFKRMNKSALFLFSLFLAVEGLNAQIFVQPGDVVTIPLPIRNKSDSAAIINNVKVRVTGDSQFVTNPTDSATESLDIGAVKIFTPQFIVGNNLNDGVYKATLKIITPDVGIAPDPAAEEISVDFIIDRRPPIVTVDKSNCAKIYGVYPKACIASHNLVSIIAADKLKGATDNTPLDLNLDASLDGASGVVRIDIFPIIDNHVQELSVFSKILTAPQAVREFDITLEHGDYVVNVYDAAGNVTIFPLKVSLLSIDFNLLKSTSSFTVADDKFIDPETGATTLVGDKSSFEGRLNVIAKSDAGLKYIGLVNSNLDSQSLTTISGEIVTSKEDNLKLGGNISDYNYKLVNYALYMEDNYNRLVWQPISFAFQSAYIGDVDYPEGGLTESTHLPVMDLVDGETKMLPGAIMPIIVSPTTSQMLALPQWRWAGRNGAYGYTSLSENIANLPYDETKIQLIGHVNVKINTWGSEGEEPLSYPVADRQLFIANGAMVDSQYKPLTCGGGFESELVTDNGGFCFSESAPTSASSVIKLKRYIDRDVTVEKLAPTSRTEVAYYDNNLDVIYANDHSPVVNRAGTYAYGIKVITNGASAGFMSLVPAGSNILVVGPNGLEIQFAANTVYTPGLMQYSDTSVEPYPGYNNNSGNQAKALSTNATFDEFVLTIPYNSAGLASSQENSLTIFRVGNNGKYQRLTTTVNTSSKTVSADLTSLGSFFVASSRYDTPVTVKSNESVAGRRELVVTTNGETVTQNVYDTTTSTSAALMNLLSQNGVVVSNVYQLGPDEITLSTPGVVMMHFDSSTLDAAGISSVSLYKASTDGAYVYQLSDAIIDKNNNEIAVEVSNPAGLYVLIGSTISAENEDITAPVAALAVGSPISWDNGITYVSSKTQISLTATDPVVYGAETSGVSGIYYLMDLSPAAGTFNAYSLPITLPGGGGHNLYYYATDAAGNNSMVSSATYNVDDAAPNLIFYAGGSSYLPGSKISFLSGTTMAIIAVDPTTNSSASGVKSIYYLVDTPLSACLATADFSGQEGTCSNPKYSVPFVLPMGAHIIYSAAKDNVGNMSAVTATNIVVLSTGSSPAILPSSGPIGVPFVITGADFGTYSAGVTTVLMGGTAAPLTLWSSDTIKGTIPGTLPAGEQTVTVMRGTSTIANSAPFTVTTPALYTLTPSSGAIGLPFTITGENFGNYVANYTKVLMGGATMPLTLWTDTRIQGTTPGNLAVGTYDLVVERALNGGVVRTSSATFTLSNMQAFWLAPSSGPIGMPFTITGEGFGNYTSAYAHVLLGDTTASLTLWTDTKIQGTVPGNLTSGQYPVVVERRTADGGLMQTSSAMTFEVVTVDVASMTPVSGPIGMPFTIYGTNFGNYVANLTRVLIGGTTAPLTLWTATQIQGTIPGSLAAGEYPVVVERELNGGVVSSTAMAFVVNTPVAYDVTPASGAIGVPFTINGENFGNYSAAYTGVLINGATVPLTLWTDTKIQGTIPGNLAAGQYPVKVARGTADGGLIKTTALTFEVLGVNIASMTPMAGPIGMPFTIYGGNFGNYAAGYTKVLIGGTTVPLTLWTDTKIQGTIPGSLVDGEYPVLVERALNGGQVQSSTLTWTLNSPAMASVAPSSGPIGLPFTINGSNFGNYVANYTKVLIGGATAPLTLWSDTAIKGTIPGNLAAGDYDLEVVRALNGGEVRTSTAGFTVTVPVLGTIDPSTAAVIAPFTITGASFGNYVANYTKVLINGTTAPLTLWTDTKIQGKLPFLLNGTYPVQVQRSLNGGLAETATAHITVAEPAISSMTPTSGAVGTVFNLYGSSFGPYDASQTRVTIGGVACALSLWTDTNIRGTVPTAISYGTYTVVAMRGQALSNDLEYSVPEAFRVSMVRPGTLLNAEFKLGEVYVYPNPAKGGKVPVFHVEVGLADTVKIKIFTVAGQIAHEINISGTPQAIDGKYAYESAWEGHIASGVYYYTMEAEKTGKKLKAKGRFAVVR